MIPGLNRAIAEAQRQSATAMTTVVLRWVTVTGGTVDPVTGELVGATRTEGSTSLKALAQHATAEFQFNHLIGVEVGDLVLDFSAATPLDLAGKQEVRFEVDGKTWLPKRDPRQVAVTPDALVGGRRIFETIVLQPAG